MVKTRNHSDTSSPIEKQHKTKRSKPKQGKLQMTAISNKQLRCTVRAKISKPKHQRPVRKQKKIDFSNEQLICITGPQKFHCPICLEIMIFPAISECGHTFCLPCIEESLKHKHNCSLCRENLTFEQFKQSSLITDIMEQVITRSLAPEQVEQYNRRKREWAEKDLEQRVPNNVKVGDSVDFYIQDTWRSGKVIEREEGEQNSITINVESEDDENLTRKILLKSRLLAKHNTYTAEKPHIHQFHGMGRFRLELAGDFYQHIAVAIMPTLSLRERNGPIRLRTGGLQPNGEFMQITLTFAPQQ